MFDGWSVDAGGERASLVRRDPPVDVVVMLARVWPPDRLRWAADTPLWARAGGLDTTAEVPGQLHAWVLTNTGHWRADVSFVATSRNGRLRRQCRELVSAEAVRPAPVDVSPH